MKKYFCDVCGAELGEGGNAPPSPASELCCCAAWKIFAPATWRKVAKALGVEERG